VDLVPVAEPAQDLGARVRLSPELEQRVVEAGSELSRRRADPGRQSHRRPEHSVVAPRDEMDGAAHEHCSNRLFAQQRTLERLPSESLEPRPEADIRRRRPLCLESGDTLERPHDRQPPAFEQQLARERGAIELPQRQRPHPHPTYAIRMALLVRMAPSPTGYLHVGGVRTFLFNWLFARHHGGKNLLRIENTDTSREVAEAVDQIQESLSWLGIDWDGPLTFQLDRMDDCRSVAEQLVSEGKAYEDEGPIRFRRPAAGVTAGDEVVRGRIEYPNDKLEDVVIVRSDGRPTYNFAPPLEDVWDGITPVIRGDDHISNPPKQLNIIRAVGADTP